MVAHYSGSDLKLSSELRFNIVVDDRDKGCFIPIIFRLFLAIQRDIDFFIVLQLLTFITE